MIVNAAIRVVATDGAPSLSATSASPAAAQAWLNALSIEVDGDVLRIRDLNHGKTPALTATLRVPRTVQLELRAANSDLVARLPRVTGVNVFACSRGDVRVVLEEAGSSGQLSLLTGLGDVELRTPERSQLAIDAQAPLGSVTGAGSNGRDVALAVTLRAGRGSIRVREP